MRGGKPGAVAFSPTLLPSDVIGVNRARTEVLPQLLAMRRRPLLRELVLFANDATNGANLPPPPLLDAFVEFNRLFARAYPMKCCPFSSRREWMEAVRPILLRDVPQTDRATSLVCFLGS